MNTNLTTSFRVMKIESPISEAKIERSSKRVRFSLDVLDNSDEKRSSIDRIVRARESLIRVRLSKPVSRLNY